MILIFCCCRDAEDAVHARDGYDYDGYRLRVEFPRGGGPGGFRGSNRVGSGGGGDRGGRGRGPPARRSQYRVLVTGNIITAHKADVWYYNHGSEFQHFILISSMQHPASVSHISCLYSWSYWKVLGLVQSTM